MWCPTGHGKSAAGAHGGPADARKTGFREDQPIPACCQLWRCCQDPSGGPYTPQGELQHNASDRPNISWSHSFNSRGLHGRTLSNAIQSLQAARLGNACWQALLSWPNTDFLFQDTYLDSGACIAIGRHAAISGEAAGVCQVNLHAAPNQTGVFACRCFSKDLLQTVLTTMGAQR